MLDIEDPDQLHNVAQHPDHSKDKSRLRRKLDSELIKSGDPRLAKSRPNVLFIAVDDLNDWIGCMGGHEQVKTPNIDRLCSKGLKYTQMYTSAPICSPARATLMTGKHPLKLNMWSHKHILPSEIQKILPGFLKDQGYQTWHVGKWHLGKPSDRTLPP